MKKTTKMQKWFLATLVGLALSAATVARADTITYLVNDYNDSTSISGDWNWWGVVNPQWDGTQNYAGSGGSFYVSAVYGSSPSGGDNQQQMMVAEDFAHSGSWNNGTTVDTTVYTNLQIWVKWNNNVTNTMTLAEFNTGTGIGGGGSLEPEIMDAGWGTHSMGGQAIPTAATTGWTPMNVQYNGATIGQASSAGVAFHVYHTTGAANLIYSFWMDHIIFQGSAVPPPPPFVSIHPVTCEGLSLYPLASAGQYQRQMIRTVNSDFSWYGHTPVSYKWSLANFSPILETNWFQQFNTGIGSWVNFYGIGTLSFDGTQDAFTNSASGSLKVVAAFTGAGGEQFDYFCTFNDRWGWDFGATHDGNAYGSLQFDIKVDPSSNPDSTGDFTSLEVGFLTSSAPGQIAIGNYTIPGIATNGWVHANVGISPNNMYTPAYGIYLKDWVNGSLTNTLTFWVDNTHLTPAPEQFHVFLIPQGTAYANLPYGFVDSSVDWNCQTMLFLRIEQEENMANATNWDGGSTAYVARFGYKTNEASSQTMIFNSDPTQGAVGLLAVLTDAQGLGDWSLTFNNNTDFTLSGPVSSTTGTIPAGSASVFNDNMALYFGAQPNSQANCLQQGQVETVNNIQVTGLADAINDSFTAPPLNTAVWAVNSAAAGAVIQIIPTNAWYIIDWSMPASGYSLLFSSDLLGTWAPVSMAGSFQPSVHSLLVLTNGQMTSDTGFFEMVKRSFTQLQILVPGLTATPGTSPGYSGTPSHQIGYGDFSVVVNSVDASWNLVNGPGDVIVLTSSDSGDFYINIGPTGLPLAGGTCTFDVEWDTASTLSPTITATDSSDGSKTAATSPAIPLN